jgi:PPE-repeat protein
LRAYAFSVHLIGLAGSLLLARTNILHGQHILKADVGYAQHLPRGPAKLAHWKAHLPAAGFGNTGAFNKGAGNTGYANIGEGNTGAENVGKGNTGYKNDGEGNTGAENIGQGNTGDKNIG